MILYLILTILCLLIGKIIPRMSTSNTPTQRGRGGCVPGFVNKTHKHPQARLPGLTANEKACLRQYQEAVKNIWYGSNSS